jgi:type VI protein secretion system component Hcp
MNSQIYRGIFRRAVLVVLVAGLFALPARPASMSQMFCVAQITTSHQAIRGTSTVPGHTEWIEMESAALGNLSLTEENHAALLSATSGAGAGKVKFNEFTITKKSDSASPMLFQAATRGEAVKLVTVDILEGSRTAPKLMHRLTITGGTMSAKPAGPGKEAIIFVGGTVAYN